MRIKFNPCYRLTPEQSRELWQCWEPIRMLVEPSKTTLVAMQLSRQYPTYPDVKGYYSGEQIKDCMDSGVTPMSYCQMLCMNPKLHSV